MLPPLSKISLSEAFIDSSLAVVVGAVLVGVGGFTLAVQAERRTEHIITLTAGSVCLVIYLTVYTHYINFRSILFE